MLRIFRELRSGRYYGKALASFYFGKYADAVRDFQKSYEIDPSQESSLQYNAFLGQSYLALGECQRACALLRHAYELWKQQSSPAPGELFDDNQVLAMLTALQQALEKTGAIEESERMRHEIAELHCGSGNRERS